VLIAGLLLAAQRAAELADAANAERRRSACAGRGGAGDRIRE
jgi:hypothetical protein